MALTIGNPIRTSSPKEDSMQIQVYVFSLYGGKCAEI